MITDEQRINFIIRDVSPCKGCAERFVACSDRCPKDQRGEYGYKAWKANIEEVKKVRKNYLNNRHEERKREKWGLKK